MKSKASDLRTDHGKAGVVLLVILLLLLVAGGSAYAIYRWQQSQVTDLKQQVSKLSTQLDDAKNQNTNTQTQEPTTYTSGKGVTIKVYTPLKNAKITSPLVVLGEVPGNWSFEASFPVVLKDATGAVVKQSPAQLLSDWMTTNLVPFSIKLDYGSNVSGNGTLILQKDNPSGLPANDDSVSIPVVFG